VDLALVLLQQEIPGEGRRAVPALEGPLARVDEDVPLEVRGPAEHLGANMTRVLLLGRAALLGLRALDGDGGVLGELGRQLVQHAVHLAAYLLGLLLLAGAVLLGGLQVVAVHVGVALLDGDGAQREWVQLLAEGRASAVPGVRELALRHQIQDAALEALLHIELG